MQAHAACALLSLSCFFWNAASRLSHPLPYSTVASALAVVSLGIANELTLSHAYWTDDGAVLFGTLALLLLPQPWDATGWCLLYAPTRDYVRMCVSVVCWVLPWRGALPSHLSLLVQYVVWMAACLSVVGD